MSASRVNVFFKTKKYDISQKALRELVLFVLVEEGLPDDCEISICLVTNYYMRILNKRYKDKYEFTDVLAFPFSDLIFNDNSVSRLLGEVIVSLDQAKIQAKLYNNSFLKETYIYIIHGVLHLLGYSDSNPKERENMFSRQDELCSKYLAQ